MININVGKTSIKVDGGFDPVTSGGVNAFMCQFTFGPDWENMVKTATFRAGKRSVSVIVPEDGIVPIPWEVVEYDGLDLYVGVTGIADMDTDERTGDVVLPTVWALIGTIRGGASICGLGNPPTPGVYEQITIEIAQLKRTKQNKLTGTAGQIVGFDEDGNAIPQDAPETVQSIDVDSTETAPYGTPASAENVGTTKDARLKFTIPEGRPGKDGQPGQPGEMGEPGQDGVSALTYGAMIQAEPSADLVLDIPSRYFNRPAVAGETFFGSFSSNGHTAIGLLSVVSYTAPSSGMEDATSSVEVMEWADTTGAAGVDGLPSLVYRSTVSSRTYPDSELWNTAVNASIFNREPIVGEVFMLIIKGAAQLSGRSWIANAKVKEKSGENQYRVGSVTCVETTGHAGSDGSNGKDALVYEGTVVYSTEPADVDAPLSLFNRTPEVDDYITFFATGSGDFANRSWTCAGAIDSVTDTTARILLYSAVETTAAGGVTEEEMNAAIQAAITGAINKEY